MHELSVTEGILKICLDEEKKHNFKKVKNIKIKVGELTGLIPSCISYYFDIVSKNTVAEGAEIKVEKIPVIIYCNDCDYKGELEERKYDCPSCKGNNYKIIGGKEFYLDTMEVE